MNADWRITVQLKFTEQKTSNKYRTQVELVTIALLLAVASIIWMLSAFDLQIGTAGNFSGGMVRIWNGICDSLGKSDFIFLTKYSGASDGSGIFLAIFGVLLTSMGYILMRSTTKCGFLLYLLPFFVIQILFDVTPSVGASVLFWMAIVISAIYNCYPSGGSIWSILLAVGIIATVGIIAYFGVGTNYKHGDALTKIQTQVAQSVESLRYGSNIRSDGNMTPTDFDSDEIVLKVTMENPQSMYLKGFSGSIYEDHKWTNLPCETYYAEQNLFYWLHEKDFSGTKQIQSVMELMDKKETNGKVIILNEGASRKYIYYPYELADDDSITGKNWSDSFLTATGIRGKSEYEYTVGTNKTAKWPSLCAEFFNTDDSKALEQYLVNESYYNVKMYEDYTELTKAQKELLAEYIGTSGNQAKGHIDYKKAINRIKQILEDNFIYTEAKLSGTDPLQSFLKERKGCDIHYATAATLMYRYYGIPARYVEGYIITLDDIKNAEPGDTIAIPASNNHAWTEIYIDGFGWVPMEVTPEYYDRMQQPDLSKGLESDKISDPFKNNRKTQQNQKMQTDSDSEEKNHDIPWKWIFLILLAGAIVAICIILIVKQAKKVIAKKKRIRLFHNTDIRLAICAIYQYMMQENIRLSDEARNVGDRAAFSLHEMTEEERMLILTELEEKERNMHEKKDTSSHDDSNIIAKLRSLRKRSFRQ